MNYIRLNNYYNFFISGEKHFFTRIDKKIKFRTSSLEALNSRYSYKSELLAIQKENKQIQVYKLGEI